MRYEALPSSLTGGPLGNTQVYTDESSGALKLRRWVVRVLAGPEEGKTATLERGTLLVGSSSSNDLVLTDRCVSRAHLELRLIEAGLQVRDLGSSNGTYEGTTRIQQSVVQGPAALRLGETEIAIEPADAEIRVDMVDDQLGPMVGTTPGMRRLFGMVCRIGPTDVTALVEGETGTGKELVAQQLHACSSRANRPLVVVDCGALPAGLIESELFGHVRGAFTGALADRDGAFAQADGGTIFLDEIGELPLDLQPKLLRVLETREYRRVGDTVYRPTDVRVIAATSKDLSTAVSQGALRPDLFYRLAVVRLRLPPLRDRIADLPRLARVVASTLAGRDVIIPDSVIRTLEKHGWPGNVRELRNVISHALALRDPGELLQLPDDWQVEAPSSAAVEDDPLDLVGDYREARTQALNHFEMRYVTALLARHKWNVSGAAREAGVDRNYLHRLIKRHQIHRP